MSLHYLLDGYNIIQQLPTQALSGFSTVRDGLVALVEQNRPQGSANNSVTVVFDGYSSLGNPVAAATVKVVFSNDHSADDKIKDIVEAARNKKRIVVVTDDKEIKFYVRGLGANVLAVTDFIPRLLPAKGTKSGPREGKHISYTLEHKITDEFKKIWLKDK